MLSFGSMPKEAVAEMEEPLPPAVKRNAAAIAYNNPQQLSESPETISFLGMLIAFAYTGHAVFGSGSRM